MPWSSRGSPQLWSAQGDRERLVLGRRGRAARRHRRERRRQDHAVQRDHRRLPGHRWPGLILRRRRHPAAALRAHPRRAAQDLPVVAAVPRAVACGTTCTWRCAASRAEGYSFFRDRNNLSAESLLDRVRLRAVADQPVSSLSHGQQRQLEVGMALAGAPRLVLFDEPAAGLSPAERAELVALLTGLPRHIGFILIEHDLDIALRVVDRVTVMHNGRLLKEGTPAEIENDPEVQAIYMGGKQPDPRDRQSRRLLRPRARAAGRLAEVREGRPGRRRPQRHGQDHAVQLDHRVVAAAPAA